jgi:uncharacterized lipoprotein YmbA
MMIRNMTRQTRRWALVGAVLLLAGCAATPDRFYGLTADGTLPSGATANALVLGIGPVDVPDYIDRDELVFQSSAHRYEVPAEHRWAGDLTDSVTGVLVSNLGHRLGTNAVHGYPWDSRLNPRYAVPVTIRQFHAVSGGDAVLDVGWEIRDGATGETVHRGAQVFSEPLTEEGYDGVVAAESRLLGQLADAIAAMLR